MKLCWNAAGQTLLGLALCMSAWQATTAASLSLVPVRISLNAKQPISAITVRNDGDEAAVVQLEAMQWSQANGKDVYAPTTEILGTPPIFTVAPGGSQLVRIGLRRGADAEHELTYRVFMQEVPPPAKADFRGLRVALRFGVPVFVAATAGLSHGAPAAVPVLQWRAHAAPGGHRITLTAANPGTAHVQVTRFSLTSPGDPAQPIEHSSTDYVFPGQSRDWQIEVKSLPAAGSPLHVSARTDAGSTMEADLLLETP